VLVIEDDLRIATAVARGLSERGFAPELHTVREGAAHRAVDGRFDAVVLDLQLPDGHGFEVLRALRGRTSAPVIVLTAGVDLAVRLEAFDEGAADFVAKPFFVEELAARLRARLHVTRPPERRLVTFGPVSVDRDARTVSVDGVDAGLTPHEFNILGALLDRRGHAVTRDHLRATCLTADVEVTDRTVDSHVGRLRRKLGAGAERIVTVWGVGYRLVDP
jgi:two-component system OmpR family response regulator